MGGEVHEQGALAEDAGEVRGDIARGHDEVAGLDAGEPSVEVVEGVEVRGPRELPAARSERVALGGGIAVLEVEKPQVRPARKPHERFERGGFLRLQVAARLRLKAAPRDAGDPRTREREALAKRGCARGIGAEERARLRREALE